MLGTNQPFIEVAHMYSGVKHIIQVDIDPMKLGKRQRTELAILADGKKVVAALNEKLAPLPESAWWRANVKNVANWNAYTKHLEESTEGPLNYYQAYNAVNQAATENAVFSIDVGDVTMISARHLKLGKGQMWRTSGLFATMGIGLPGSITAKLDFPNRQVWSLSGDGGFSMVMQDIVTQVKEKLGIINVVFSNDSFGFIKDEQEGTNKGFYGVELHGIDFAKIAEAMGAKGYTATKQSELKGIFDKAVEDVKKSVPVVIDVKISNESPLPTMTMELDPDKFSSEQIAEFKKRYHAEGLVAFSQYLKEEGLENAGTKLVDGGF
jgi:pyruvate oxidase